ncbi:Voltage-dependent N-type calcium channel subunit alpha-1B [Symbiodinium microadriaticum]|uniref:Voltage-dependent N-type calcium channel subunit alpha-1B n=1 Tax=Symbiodinium microadriaticum TaxID=2951 RepID=A0A1Q9C2G2_SYMMI|nr:Voltage-dependent N-type calcium channel subunit alpha-1B [Symbiodinium microadriaticum]
MAAGQGPIPSAPPMELGESSKIPGRRPSLELPPRRGAWAESRDARNERRPTDSQVLEASEPVSLNDTRSQESDHAEQADLPDLFKERRAVMEDEARKAEAYEEALRAEEEQLGAKAVQVMKAMRMDMQSLDSRRQVMHNWISWSGFDSAVGVVIIANAVTIGLETHYASLECAAGPSCESIRIPTWLSVVDNVFFAIYVLEFGLRYYVYGWTVIKSNWIKFDIFLIVSSTIDLILRPIQFDSELLDQMMVVRMLRLARLARAVRLMVQFQTLWQLVQGLMHSLTTLLWTFLLIMILMYVFAILGMEVITIDTRSDPGTAYNTVAAANFRSFQDAILTLLQIFSLDSIGSIYRPLVNHRMFLFFYFIAAILVLAIALLNLVTAVMVNTSLDQASQDKEAKKAWEAAKRKKEVEQLKRLFGEFDEDGSGELTLEELASAPEELLGDLKELSGIDDVEELFNLLDYDGGGAIDTNEFCEGVLKVAGDSRNSVEMGRLMKQCNEILSNTNAVMESVKAPEESVKGRGPRGSRFTLDERQGPGLTERVVKLESEVSDLHGDLWWAVNKLQCRANARAGHPG